MHKDAFLTEADDEGLAGPNVLSFNRPEIGDPLSIGSLAGLIVSDAAVKMKGRFRLPKLVARSFREEEAEQSGP